MIKYKDLGTHYPFIAVTLAVQVRYLGYRVQRMKILIYNLKGRSPVEGYPSRHFSHLIHATVHVHIGGRRNTDTTTD
jgi:hypothetical protein